MGKRVFWPAMPGVQSTLRVLRFLPVYRLKKQFPQLFLAYRPKKEASTFFVAGATVIAGLPGGMTRHAGAHIVRHLLGDDVALTNRSMAGLAGCACFAVHTMAEVNEIRKAVDADPGNRLLRFGGGGQLLNVRTIALDGLVTGHAKTLRRIPHQLTRLWVLVTRVALQSKGQVCFMAVGNRLLLAIHSSGQQQQSRTSKDTRCHFGVT